MNANRISVRTLFGRFDGGRCGELLAVAIIFAVSAGISFGEDPARAIPNARAAAKRHIVGAQEKNQRVLEEQTEFEFLDTPLKEVVDFLKLKHKVPVELDTSTLEKEGIGSDTPINRNLRGITLRGALDIMLDQHRLAYSAQDEVILITTLTKIQRIPLVKTYPIVDILGPNNLPAEFLEVVKLFQGQPGNPSLTGKLQNEARDRPNIKVMVDQLFLEPPEKTIPERMAAGMFPESKENPEECEATVHPRFAIFRGMLVVRAHELDHRRIESFLEDFRELLTEANPVVKGGHPKEGN